MVQKLLRGRTDDKVKYKAVFFQKRAKNVGNPVVPKRGLARFCVANYKHAEILLFNF
jgi:hypothetical protein